MVYFLNSAINMSYHIPYSSAIPLSCDSIGFMQLPLQSVDIAYVMLRAVDL